MGRTGYSFTITVDPVRINRLSHFGTPEEVADKLVQAELHREGVVDFQLADAPTLSHGTDCAAEYYQISYVSRRDGNRGERRFVAKLYIYRNMVYALTMQCNEED